MTETISSKGWYQLSTEAESLKQSLSLRLSLSLSMSLNPCLSLRLHVKCHQQVNLLILLKIWRPFPSTKILPIVGGPTSPTCMQNVINK